MARPRSALLVVLLVGLALTAPAAPALADDCTALGGTVAGDECQIATAVTAPPGSYEVERPLHVLATGQIVVPPPGGSLSLVIQGALLLEPGAKIGSPAAMLTITATGDIEVRGSGGAGAAITADCDGSQSGDVSLRSTGGRILVGPGAAVHSFGACPTGAITLVTDVGDVQIDGAVESAGPARGGPIDVRATGALRLGAAGVVSSRGPGGSADLVHLESGGDTVIAGRVESAGGTAPDPGGRCPRPASEPQSTGCVEAWVGGRLRIEGAGSISADGGRSGLFGVCCSWIDLFVTGDLTVAGPPAGPYAVRAVQFLPQAPGGRIRATTVTGRLSAGGRAFLADGRAGASSGGTGGRITVEAGQDVALGGASVRAVALNGGDVRVRSFHGGITGGPPGELNAAGTGGAVTLEACTTIDYTGVETPTASRTPGLCAESPSVPVALPKPLPAIVLDGLGTFPFQEGVTRTASATVLGVSGEVIATPLATITYTDAGGAAVPGASASGVYTVTAVFPGNAQYRAATATGTITITESTASPTWIVVQSATVTYDRAPHPADFSTTPPGIAPITCTYNGSTPAPVNAGTYSAVCRFAGNLTHLPATSNTATIVIARATVLVVIELGPQPVVYDGDAHEADVHVTGVEGEDLGTVAPTYNGATAVPRNAGEYLVVAQYPGSQNYEPAADMTTLTITAAAPRLVFGPLSFAYDEAPHAVTASAVGVGVSPPPLGPATITYVGLGGPPTDAGSYAVIASYTSTGANYSDVTETRSLVIAPATPQVVVDSLTFAFDGSTKAATGRVLGVNDAMLGTPAFSYFLGGVAAVPRDPCVYTVIGAFAGGGNYTSATGSGTLTILAGEPEPTEPCVRIDFREITYFRDRRVLTSSDPTIDPHGFDPSVWPFDPRGRRGRTASRPTLFRIYGFAPEQLGAPIPNADDPGGAYEVLPDGTLPGAPLYIDLGGPAAVIVCVSQLQTALVDERRADEPWLLPGTTVLAEAEKNVPGVLLTHNAARLSIPKRVRHELRALGMPLADSQGREVRHGIVDYVGVQLWGHGGADYREFVDLRVAFVHDDPTDRARHYRFGLHTVRRGSYESGVGCNYLDHAPGNDGLRLNDVWSGKHAGDPNWGPACGRREPRDNQRVREDYDVPVNAVQLLPTVNTGDDTVRLFFGAIRAWEGGHGEHAGDD